MRLPPLVPATLVRRYKRFLCDAVMESGEEITAYCPNPGSMLGLATPGSRIWLADHRGTGRKLGFAWMLVEAEFPGFGRELVGIDTALPNALVEEALRGGRIPALAGYASLRREVRYGANSRVDFLLEGPGRAPCWLEVKTVHLMRRPGLAEFPDCVTKRGAKHLVDLAARVAAGDRAAMLYVIQMRAEAFAPAADIDAAYAAGVAAARVQTIDEVLADPQIAARGMVVEQDHPVLGRVKLPNLPFRLSGCDTSPRSVAPLLGQHNAEIARSLGRSEADIAAMQKDGVLHAEAAAGRA